MPRQKVSRLKIYIDYGLQDEYRYAASSEELRASLKEGGNDVRLHLLPGGHDFEFLKRTRDLQFAFWKL